MRRKITISELVAAAEQRGCPIWQVVLEREERLQGTERQDIWHKMKEYWMVMKGSLDAGTKPGNRSLSGLVGEEGALLTRYIEKTKPLSGYGSVLAAARAMGVAVVNASQGRIVAAPTAGSCGILPAVLATVAEETGAVEDAVVGALFTAAGVGMVIDEHAGTAGAKSGCQAECGSASCMAAVAAAEMAGGTPRQAANAGALALKNFLGLVCDPVAGLVEIPCVKRNAIGAGVALLAADMALAGIESKIPLDEVIQAMKEIGDAMPASLKETSLAGLAGTPTAREIEKRMNEID
ncbi:MAG TPA: L-serine ammonia-lyase, iron-sulfur-dependent, subunit alpha [Syntrophomonadaceae bacterium]|nr:L-serine ammonia-lyase, iron-sulfur-dependent, subunit alpha [Syntrophomonadaceae bacterium]